MQRHLFEIVTRHAQQTARKTAISKWVAGQGFVETSYGELVGRARRIAAGCAQETSPRTVLPMLVGKGADSIAFMLGAAAAGRPFCFLSPKYRAPQVAAVLEATGSPVAVLDATGLMALRGSWKDHPRLAQTKWFLIGEPPRTKMHARAEAELRETANMIRIDVAAESADASPRVDTEPRRDMAGACLFTSGSTGAPKGVLIGEADLMERMKAEIEWFALTREDVLLSILPFSFDVGLNQLMTALGVGGELVLLDSWLPADIAAVSAARRVTGISGVPAIWQDVINAGTRFDKRGQHASLRYVTVSGGSLSRGLLQELRETMSGVQIFKTYGQTEAFRATSLRPEDFERKPDSVGKPFTGTRVYVVREDLTRCEAGEVGEVVHSGLGTMIGYLESSRTSGGSKLRKNPFHGEEDPSPVAVFTGDLGYFDEEGYLYLKGRRDSMLKVMGNRVYPQEVADQILALDAVREAVVLGVTGADGQTKLLAFIAASDGSGLSAGGLRRALNASLPTFMVPKEIVFVHQVPRTPSGKPDQHRLMEEYLASSARAGEASDGAVVGDGA